MRQSIAAIAVACVALGLAMASCGTSVVASAGGTTTGTGGAHTGPGTRAGTTSASVSASTSTSSGMVNGACRGNGECTSNPDYGCLFTDACLGPTSVCGLEAFSCTHDTDCQSGQYCRECSAGGKHICDWDCDGGPCAPNLLQTCTTDSDCPAFCINGYCSPSLGYCMNCT
jgi:hypothetical protein